MNEVKIIVKKKVFLTYENHLRERWGLYFDSLILWFFLGFFSSFFLSWPTMMKIITLVILSNFMPTPSEQSWLFLLFASPRLYYSILVIFVLLVKLGQRSSIFNSYCYYLSVLHLAFDKILQSEPFDRPELTK